MSDKNDGRDSSVKPWTELRLRLLANGYVPLPGKDKRCRLSEWPVVKIDEAFIRGKDRANAYRMTTCIRLDARPGHVPTVIDFDVRDAALVKGALADLKRIAPKVAKHGLVRGRTGSTKVAVFCQATQTEDKRQTSKWQAPGETDPENYHRIEIWCGYRGGARQFGAFGTHTLASDDKPEIVYEWQGQSPLDVPLADLPVITIAQVDALVEAFEARAAAAGLVKMPSRKGKVVARRLYDLTDEMTFEAEDGRALHGLRALSNYYWEQTGKGHDARVSSSFTGDGGTNRTKCHVGFVNETVNLYDYEDGITHYPVGSDKIADEETLTKLGQWIAENPSDGFEGPLKVTPEAKASRKQKALTAAVARMQDEGRGDEREQEARKKAVGRLLAAQGFNELAMAKAMRDIHGDEILYDCDRGKWFWCDDAAWSRDAIGQVMSKIGMLIDDVLLYMPATQEFVATKNRISSSKFMTGIEKIMRSLEPLAVTSKAWDADLWTLGTPDGVADLRTGIVRKTLPEDHITKVTPCGPAKAGTTAPRFLKFLDELFDGEAAKIRLMQQWAGYCLTGSTRSQRLMFVYGAGGNGKSTLLRLLGRLAGDYYDIGDKGLIRKSNFLQHPAGVASLVGLRSVVIYEVPENTVLDGEALKSLTGGDPLKARFMGQDFFTYEPAFSLTVVGNHLPALEHIDLAIRRRLVLLELDKVIPPERRNENLMAELIEAEGPAILRWMIDGAVDWYRHGLLVPETVQQATQEFLDDADIVQAFFDERTRQAAADEHEPSRVLYQALLEYGRSRERKSMPSETDFGRRVAQIPWIRKHRSNSGVRYYGVRLVDPLSALSNNSQ